MRKKKAAIKIVTTSHLKKELQRLRKDLGKDVEKRVARSVDIAEKSLRLEIIASTLNARQRLEEKLSAATDKILTRVDPFVKEVRDSFEERSIVANQIADVREKVDNHEERIERLESAKATA